MAVGECWEATEDSILEAGKHIPISHKGHFLFQSLSFWNLNRGHFASFSSSSIQSLILLHFCSSRSCYIIKSNDDNQGVTVLNIIINILNKIVGLRVPHPNESFVRFNIFVSHVRENKHQATQRMSGNAWFNFRLVISVLKFFHPARSDLLTLSS